MRDGVWNYPTSFDSWDFEARRAEILGGGFVPAMGTAASRLIPDGPNKFQLILDTTPLQPGRHYRLCMDLDGIDTSLSFGDTGLLAFSTPALGPSTTSILRTANQVIQVTCRSCSSSSFGHLVDASAASGCDDWGLPRIDASVPTPLYNLPLPNRTVVYSGLWAFLADTTLFQSGQHYRICIDIDRYNADLRSGDTGLMVYTTPVLSVSPSVIDPALQQILTMPCDSCSTFTEGYLSTDCSTSAALSLPGGRFQVSPTGGTLWQLSISATSGVPGKMYSLCLDMDGSFGTLPDRKSVV